MRKILKKTATLMMTAVIGVSMSYPKMTVYAGQRMQMQEMQIWSCLGLELKQSPAT